MCSVAEAQQPYLCLTYLQAFYFSLKTKDVVFHVAAVEALLALFLWGRWALGGRLLSMDSLREVLPPLLGQSDRLLATSAFIRIIEVLFSCCESERKSGHSLLFIQLRIKSLTWFCRLLELCPGTDPRLLGDAHDSETF